MPYIHTIPQEEATGKLRELYNENIQNDGWVDPGTKAFGLKPEVVTAYRNLLKTIKSSINPRHYELSTIATSLALKNSL